MPSDVSDEKTLQRIARIVVATGAPCSSEAQAAMRLSRSEKYSSDFTRNAEVGPGIVTMGGQLICLFVNGMG